MKTKNMSYLTEHNNLVFGMSNPENDTTEFETVEVENNEVYYLSDFRKGTTVSDIKRTMSKVPNFKESFINSLTKNRLDITVIAEVEIIEGSGEMLEEAENELENAMTDKLLLLID